MGTTYQPRVLRHNLFELQTASDLGVDAIPKASITLANADSHFSEIERSVGWKGAGVTVRFLFFKLKDNEPETESMILFKGIANPPGRNHGIHVSADGGEPDEPAAGAAASGARRTALSVGFSEHFRTSGKRRRRGDRRAAIPRFFRCGYSPDVGRGRQSER